MEPMLDHISVCICTYKRPQMLVHLLSELQNLKTENVFTYSVVVVDNDSSRSAENAVLSIKEKSKIAIAYYSEPEQNIALARNMAIENAKGDFIAFIDDDEFPEAEWLLNLYKTIKNSRVDGVLGPVRPYYPDGVPQWLIKSKLCERSEHETGTILRWDETRTGNVLLKKNLFDDSKHRFGREFGLSGGEDMEFFKKMFGIGKVFVWCNEAPVFETVPPARWSEIFHKKKNLRIGGLTGEKIRKTPSQWYLFIKASLALVLYIVALPIAARLGKPIYMRCLCKYAYYNGWLKGFFGYAFNRNRDNALHLIS